MTPSERKEKKHLSVLSRDSIGTKVDEWIPGENAQFAYTATGPIIRCAITCDAAGLDKDEFSPGGDVYVRGCGFTPYEEVTIYIIPNGKDAVPDNAIASEHAWMDAYGWIPKTDPVLVWSNIGAGEGRVFGDYDIWVDVDQNGVYNCGDVWLYSAFTARAFFVIPEPMAIISTLSMFAALATVHLFRKRKLHPFSTVRAYEE